MTTIMTPWRRAESVSAPFRQEMETLFDRFFGSEPGNGQTIRTWTPRVDVEETEKEMLVKCDLPGVDPKDVDVSVADGILTVRGEKREEKEEKKKNFHRVERFVGQFYREVHLPSGFDGTKVSATSSKGVVTVTIPKSLESQPRKISVKAQD